MTLDFNQLALLVLLTTAIHWLVARAAITKWFWDLRWWPTKRCTKCEGRFFKLRNRSGIHHACNGAAYTEIQREGLPLIRDQLSDLLDELLACAACSGFWLGLGLSVVGLRPLELGPSWLDVAGSALAGVVGTPILEGVLLWGLDRTAIR